MENIDRIIIRNFLFRMSNIILLSPVRAATHTQPKIECNGCCINTMFGVSLFVLNATLFRVNLFNLLNHILSSITHTRIHSKRGPTTSLVILCAEQWQMMKKHRISWNLKITYVDDVRFTRITKWSQFLVSALCKQNGKRQRAKCVRQLV